MLDAVDRLPVARRRHGQGPAGRGRQPLADHRPELRRHPPGRRLLLAARPSPTPSSGAGAPRSAIPRSPTTRGSPPWPTAWPTRAEMVARSSGATRCRRRSPTSCAGPTSTTCRPRPSTPLDDLPDDPQVVHNEVFLEREPPGRRPHARAAAGGPVLGHAAGGRHAAPMYGEHSDEIVDRARPRRRRAAEPPASSSCTRAVRRTAAGSRCSVVEDGREQVADLLDPVEHVGPRGSAARGRPRPPRPPRPT